MSVYTPTDVGYGQRINTATTTTLNNSAPCAILRIFVAASTSGTIAITDGGSTVLNTMTVTAGSTYSFGIRSTGNNALAIVTTNTIDCMVVWVPITTKRTF